MNFRTEAPDYLAFCSESEPRRSVKKMKKTLQTMSAFWVVGCLFVLIDLGRHIMSCIPPCKNHWIEVSFFAVVLVLAILGGLGKRRPAFILLAPAIIMLLICGTETVVVGGGWIAGRPTFELLYRPVLGTILGLGTIVVLAIVKWRRKSEQATAPYSEPVARSPQG